MDMLPSLGRGQAVIDSALFYRNRNCQPVYVHAAGFRWCVRMEGDNHSPPASRDLNAVRQRSFKSCKLLLQALQCANHGRADCPGVVWEAV